MGKSNGNFLGGFSGVSTNIRLDQAQNVPDGIYTNGDIHKMRIAESWPSFTPDVGIGTFIDANVSNTGSVDLSGYEYVFVSVAAGGASGAHDNDCRNQGPGGNGGLGKALIYTPDLGPTGTTLNYNIGGGGAGVSGNDAHGQGGGSSNITVGNFSMSPNGGSGGRASNTSQAPSGSCPTPNGPYSLFSTSDVAKSPAVTDRTKFEFYQYVSMPTSAGGSGGRCGEGGSSNPGTPGFIYVRYGAGINASTTLSVSADEDGGPQQAYTASY